MSTLRALRTLPLDVYCLDRSSPFFSDPFAPVAEQTSPWEVEEIPAGWARSVTREWTYFTPPVPLAEQGWKVHVCATMDTATEVLRVVADHCIRHTLHFKHLSTPFVLELSNSKYAARYSSGKFITVYPATHDQLMTTLRELDQLIGGCPGPYILSDHRWNQGPLHLRYGAFRHLPLQDSLGHVVSGLRQPDGSLVPDERTPYFDLPSWVQVPAEIQQSLSAQDEDLTMAYDFTEALHFSNGGGVYRAVQRSSGTVCIIKEARPHAGLDGLRDDAVARLEREASVLTALESIDRVPRMLERFSYWEHAFLAMEQVEGISLRQWSAQNSPDVRPNSTDRQRAEYGRRCELIIRRLTSLVQEIHRRGWIHGDLHPNNVMVTEDLEVSLLDFEQSCPIAAPHRPGLGARGFTRAHHGSRPLSTTDDLYGLAAVGLWLFSPLLMMLTYRPRLARRLIHEAQERFDLSSDWVRLVEEHLLRVIQEDHWITDTWSVEGSRTPDLDELKQDSVMALTAQLDAARPGACAQQTPLFPGDVHQLITDQVNLTSGDAGPLYALQSAGVPVPEWALDHLHERASELQHPGLLCGLAGPALVLQRAGRQDQARRLLDRAVGIAGKRRDITLSTGRAGVILALLSEEFGLQEDLVCQAVELATGINDGAVYGAQTSTGDAAGLAEGHSGAAVACARLSRVLGSQSWADRARHFFERDLECTEISDDMRLVKEDGILYPYLAHGAAGLLLTWGELKICGADPDESIYAELMASLEVTNTVEAGLYDGGIGLAAALQHLATLRVDIPEGVMLRHLRAAGDFTVPAPAGGKALAGRGLCAISLDLSTGIAGWLATATAVDRGISPLPALNAAHLPPSDPSPPTALPLPAFTIRSSLSSLTSA